MLFQVCLAMSQLIGATDMHMSPPYQFPTARLSGANLIVLIQINIGYLPDNGPCT